jgi:hypothetical protein
MVPRTRTSAPPGVVTRRGSRLLVPLPPYETPAFAGRNVPRRSISHCAATTSSSVFSTRPRRYSLRLLLSISSPRSAWAICRAYVRICSHVTAGAGSARFTPSRMAAATSFSITWW